MRRSLITVTALLLTVSALVVVPGRPLAALGCDASVGDPLGVPSGHNHQDPAQHAQTTTNLEFVGHLNFPPSLDGVTFTAPVLDGPVVPEDLHHIRAAYENSIGGATFGEVDVLNDHAVVAAISSPLGVWITDVSDPANPAVVSRWTIAGGGYVTDVKWGGTGNVFYASVQGSSKSGLYVVDASDKAAPKTIQFVPVPSGVHMIAVYPQTPLVDVVYGATGTSAGLAVVLVEHGLPHKAVRLLPMVTGIVPHDIWLDLDVLTGQILLYVANSYGGAVIMDATIPGAPVEVGRWAGVPGLYMHTIRASVDVLTQKRTVFVSPEYFFGSSSRPGTIYALDWTDLDRPTLAGTWTNPGGHAAGQLTWSTHNFQLVDDKIYLAMYHGGVWVIDVSDPANMVTRAYHLPHDHTFSGWGGWWAVMSYVPSVWDVVVYEGREYVGDITGGLYVLHYTCDETGPNGPTSRG